MCGIAGKVSFTSSVVRSEDIKSMVQSIRHRGPDDQGIYISQTGSVGLGHARLSVIDISPAGHQPMGWKNRYWIVFNGEIYNYQKLKSSSKALFQSHTDTEVILAMYDRYGPVCVDHLQGMFAFTIYDTEKDILFCARDRLGQKPFKYTLTNTAFLFASEAKAILTQKEYVKEPDHNALRDYLTFGYCPAPATGFQGIHKLPPGHTLTLDLKSKKIQLKRYWRPPTKVETIRTPKEYSQAIRKTLTNAVTKRLIADVPLGAFLSGGLDSSIIVALMAKVGPKPPQTFSVGFENSKYNELPFARIVAKAYRTDHTELIIRPQDIASAPELASQFDEPFADSSALATHALSKLTRQHVTVALSGDGGDELFGGYKRYTWLTNLKRYGSVARLLGRAIHRIYPTNATHRLLEYTKSHPDTAAQYLDMMSIFPDKKLTKGRHSFHPYFANATPVDGARYTDIATYLPDDLLQKVDITSMAHALEVRSPFLDHSVIEAIAGIPASLIKQKKILKDTFADILPSQILRRSKKGFTVPINAWLKGDIDNYMKSILLSPKTAAREYYNQTEVKLLLKQHQQQTGNFAPQLWALLMLELWLQTYFD